MARTKVQLYNAAYKKLGRAPKSEAEAKRVLKRKSGKKKNTSRPKKARKVKTMARRRSYGRKRSSGRKKFSAFKLVKGVVYTGAVALPMYQAYTQLGGGATGATGAIKAAAFIDPATGSFSMAHGAQIWMPVAALAVVDFVTTKIPIQQKISRGVNNLIG